MGETATRAEAVDWVRGTGSEDSISSTRIFLIDGDAKLSGEVAVATAAAGAGRAAAGGAEIRAAGFGAARRR